MQLIKDEENKSKEIPIYRKDEIYLGLKETSFEELKAQKWFKLQKTAQNARTPIQHKLNHDKIARNDHIEFNMDESLSELKVLYEVLYLNRTYNLINIISDLR